ncbi:MAG TPA: ATP-binding protein [Actinomycetota bacterium]|nr:ATP-binding protein [Actinomycetota bacterium]
MTIVKAHPLPDKASLSGIRRQIRLELNRLRVDPSELFDCLVAVTEAGTHALLHGMSQDRPPTVTWDIGRDVALFDVHDFGSKAWSRVSHPSRRDDHPDDADRLGSYGLEIMRGLMDEVDIEVGPDGTHVRLVKRFS